MNITLLICWIGCAIMTFIFAGLAVKKTEKKYLTMMWISLFAMNIFNILFAIF